MQAACHSTSANADQLLYVGIEQGFNRTGAAAAFMTSRGTKATETAKPSLCLVGKKKHAECWCAGVVHSDVASATFLTGQIKSNLQHGGEQVQSARRQTLLSTAEACMSINRSHHLPRKRWLYRVSLCWGGGGFGGVTGNMTCATFSGEPAASHMLGTTYHYLFRTHQAYHASSVCATPPQNDCNKHGVRCPGADIFWKVLVVRQ